MSFLLLFNFGSCFSQDTEISNKPEEEMVKLLNEKRILMLADFGHHKAEPYYSLLKLLDKYFQTENPQSISLIMEFDSLYANKLIRYLRHGSVDSLFDIYYRANLEDIEFWSVLKDFNHWVEEKTNKKDLIKIKGFEMIVDENFYGLSTGEADSWFVPKRDSIAASGIINYVQNNPGETVLIFYGNAHLLDSLQSKQTYTLTGEESKGYYLVNYLRREFEKEKVVTVNQVIVDSTIYSNPVLEKYNSDVILKTSILPFGEINRGNFDYTILRRNLFSPPPHRLSMIFSRKAIEKAIIKLKEIEQHISRNANTWVKREYDEILENSYILTGLKFNGYNDLDKWYKKNSYSGMGRLTSNEFKQFLFDYVYEDVNNFNEKKREKLFELGFGPGILSAPIPAKEEWVKDEDAALEMVKFHNAVSVYWLGYPDEKEKAKEILVKFSNLIFENPLDYIKWFRKRYYLWD